MFFLRWIPTFLAFPLGESVASALVPGRTPLAMLVMGAAVGGVVGGAQWLALGRLVDWRWAAVTLGATAVATFACTLVVGAPSGTLTAAATGLIVGAAVGGAQGPLLRRSPRIAVVWMATVALSWGGAGAVSAMDRDLGVFGSNGALAATLVTGVVLRIALAPRLGRPSAEPPVSSRTMEVAATIVAAQRQGRRDGG